MTIADSAGRGTFWRHLVRHKPGMFGACIIGIALIVAIFAPQLTPWAWTMYDEQMQPPSAKHPLGTDPLGRDVLSMIIWGTRISLTFSVGVAGISLIIGVVLGAVPAYYGGWVDDLFSRAFEVFMLIPRFFLIVIVVALFGTNIVMTMIIVGATAWVTNARLTRAQVLSLKERTFVQASRFAGASSWRLLFKHILPNGLYPVIANSSLQMAGAILTESALSFLGMGDTNFLSWGQVLHTAHYHIRAWWLSLFPGLAIFVLAFGFNLLGDGVSYALNPRLHTRKG